MGKAVGYVVKEWEKLIRYLDSPYLTPDTNRIENAIRPFVVGRKNWLFVGSVAGGERAQWFGDQATLYMSNGGIHGPVEHSRAQGVHPVLEPGTVSPSDERQCARAWA